MRPAPVLRLSLGSSIPAGTPYVFGILDGHLSKLSGSLMNPNDCKRRQRAMASRRKPHSIPLTLKPRAGRQAAVVSRMAQRVAPKPLKSEGETSALPRFVVCRLRTSAPVMMLMPLPTLSLLETRHRVLVNATVPDLPAHLNALLPAVTRRRAAADPERK
jgi:hypothetical protein